MKKIVFFGSIGLAKKCLEEIILMENVELLGVVCSPIKSNWRNEENVYEYCLRNNIPLLTFKEIEELNPDIGISIRFDKVIPKSTIEVFSQGIFNTHGGILPEYRGSYCNINTILNKEKYFGVTLHYISEGLDTGDIVAIKKVEIKDRDTGFSLYQESEKLCYEVLKDNFKDIINDNNIRVTQDSLIAKGHTFNTYTTKKTIEKKEIPFEKLQESLHIIRAFDSPHHEPAFTYFDSEKVFLRVNH